MHLPSIATGVFLIIGIILPDLLSAQPIHWDGGGGDSLWTTPANWSGDEIPQAGTDVVLNNAYSLTGYKVLLPSGTVAVSIRSLSILPSGGQTIELEIPKTNTAVPALATQGNPGIVLGAGAVFKNASGATSGQVVTVSDSLRILSGGRFIQQSETAHATLIARLSTAGETATGSFVFNVPGSASYTVSVSGRTYGTLQLSADAAGGTKKYLSSGSNPFTIRGDFLLGAGVSYALNLSGLVRIRQAADIKGTLNLSSGSLSNTLIVEKDLHCSGIITESGTAAPIVELGGTAPQQLSLTGSISNSVGVRVNNVAGIWLASPVSLPYKLILAAGILTSAPEKLLTLKPGCVVEFDSLSRNTFVSGPLQRIGLTGTGYARFPVGREGRYRGLSVYQPAGDITVEYICNNPRSLSDQLGENLYGLAVDGYWAITAADLSGSALLCSVSPEFSSTGFSWGAVRVTGLYQGKWVDWGNTSWTDQGNGFGSVTSQTLPSVASGTVSVTLALYDSAQKVLPGEVLTLNIRTDSRGYYIEGCAAPGADWITLRVEGSADGQHFSVLYSEDSAPRSSCIRYRWASQHLWARYFRIAGSTGEGVQHFSRIAAGPDLSRPLRLIRLWPNPARYQTALGFFSPISGKAELSVINLTGKSMRNYTARVQPGYNTIVLPLDGLPTGHYWITAKEGFQGLTPLPLVLIR